MSAISPDAQRALTEKRGKELDRWIEMKCIRFMSGIEPFSPTLSDLPTEIIHHVLEKMEPMNRLRARKVCRSLRTAVDKVGLRFDYIKLFLEKDELKMNLSGTNVRYTKAANGNSNVIHEGHAKLIDGETCVERALNDFKILSKHARKIDIRNYSEDRRDIVTSLIELFKSQKCIHMEMIKLEYFSFDAVLTILPCFDAKKLKKIVLSCIASIDQFERITHLEQWENAEEVRIISSEIASTMIVHLFHFKLFWIHVLKEFPAQTAIQIRDDLLRRSTFQSCIIYFDRLKSNPIDIAKVFKPDYAGGNEFKFEFSSGNNKFNILLKEMEHMFQLDVKRL